MVKKCVERGKSGYDALGRPAGFVLGSDYSVSYGYDEVGRFSSVTSFVAFVPFVVNYSYLTGTDLLSGWSSPTGHAVIRSFEPNRDLLTAVSNRYNGATVSAFDYINDALSRRVQRTDSGSATATNAFGYNSRSELSSARVGTNSYGYAYDAIGNRLAVSNNAEALTYAANALNQYTNITDGDVVVPQYDLDGNLTNYNGWTFAWDGENRLVLALNAATVVSNSYDYMSRRVQKVVDSTTHTFQYDGWAMIQETTGTQTNSYAYGLDLSGSLQGAGTIGGLLAVVCNGQPYHPEFDANGNVTDYVDTNGTVVAHYEFDAFGNTVAQSGTLTESFAFRFSTKYLDDEPGLYYYGYRYYSPELGRWLSRDPADEQAGPSLLCYQSNDAVNFVDPLGLWQYQRSTSEETTLVTTDADDTIQSLSTRIGLKATEYNQWLSPANSQSQIPDDSSTVLGGGCQYRIPNTIVAWWSGDLGLVGRGLVDWDTLVQRVAADGYYVVPGRSQERVRLALQRALEAGTRDKTVHGFVYQGHGSQVALGSSGWMPGVAPRAMELYYRDYNFPNSNTFEPGVNIQYKLGFVIILSCASANGRTALFSETQGGVFLGFNGWMFPVLNGSTGGASTFGDPWSYLQRTPDAPVPPDQPVIIIGRWRF
jgi:RHS repeat-associated protein